MREAWSNDDGRVPGLWEQLGEMGVLGLLAPEAERRPRAVALDLVLVLEETGRLALPEPIVETAAVGLPLLAPRARSLAVAASASRGRSPLGADAARTRLMLSPTAGSTPSSAPRVTLVARPSVDGSRRLFDVVQWKRPGTRVDAARVLAGLRPRRPCGIAAAAARGLADACSTLTVDYVKERHQFGGRSGRFQAVKHHLADARIALEFARPLVYRAACVARAGRSRHAACTCRWPRPWPPTRRPS